MVAAENRSSASNASSILYHLALAHGDLLAGLHPLFQYPRLVDTNIEGLVAALMEDLTPRSTFGRESGEDTKGPSDILLLRVNFPVTQKTLGFNWDALKASFNVTTALVIGPHVDAGLRSKRGRYAESGMYFAAQSEIATFATVADGPQAALEVFHRIITA